MHKTVVLGLIALAGFLPLPFAANQACAQQAAYSVGVPRIDGFDVESVKRAAPGNELAFILYGSPGGAAAVQIAGATGGVVLVETEPGVYEGSYTIRMRDKITAKSTATANLRLGNRVVSVILDETLIGKASAKRPAPAASAGSPKVDRFDVDAPARLVAGEELVLTLSGTPGGAASARIVGVKGKIVLNEVRPGMYEGSYTIKNRDRIAANSAVTGNLRRDGRETKVVFGHPLVTGEQRQSSSRPAHRICPDCGVVEAINVVEVQGQGSYLGPIAGGVAGALLGSQVGHGSGTTIAQVLGAAGGAYAGSAIEKKVKATKHFEVVVRLDNGGTRTVSYDAHPGFAIGARVKVANGTLTVIQ